MDNIAQLLARCHRPGRQAAEKGNAPVGAIVVKNGAVIGEGEEAGKSKSDVNSKYPVLTDPAFWPSRKTPQVRDIDAIDPAGSGLG